MPLSLYFSRKKYGPTDPIESPADPSTIVGQRDQCYSFELLSILSQVLPWKFSETLHHSFSRAFGRLSSRSRTRPTDALRVEDGSSVIDFKPLPRLHALLIGINEYKSKAIPKLSGAEADAQAFKQYLECYLKVPTDQIQTILGRNGTRSQIIKAFRDLAGDQRIQRGDPIFIFYAGHGGQLSTPDGWEAGGTGSEIQMLIPQDYACSRRGRQVIHGIPDRVIGALLNLIAKAKGDNITVVFDCCNAASGTRRIPGIDDIRVRSMKVDKLAYDPQVDQDILCEGSIPFTPSERSSFNISRSHILLAACESSGIALETNGHGNFSTALLKLLRKTPPDELEYYDILKKMERIPNQKPQCEGNNLHRTLFDAKVNPAPHFQSPPRGRRLEHSGIPPRSQLSTSILSSPLRTNHNLPLRALWIENGFEGVLRLYIPPTGRLRELFNVIFAAARRSTSFLDNISVVDNPRDAHVSVIQVPPKEIGFDILDKRVTDHRFRPRLGTVLAEVELIVPILDRIGHFYKELNQRPKLNVLETHWVGVEFYELESEGEPRPHGENLCKKGVIDLEAQAAQTRYGIKITNRSCHDLYLSLVYFNVADLSITTLFQSPVSQESNQSESPLKTSGNLTIGYGSGGVGPIVFVLAKEQAMNMGFLQLIFSTRASELFPECQESPFTSARQMIVLDRPQEYVRGSVLIPVTLRRAPA